MLIGSAPPRPEVLVDVFGDYAIEQETMALGLDLTDTNKRRVRKAMDICHKREFIMAADFGVEQMYFVQSQSDDGRRYIVLHNGVMKCKCNCEDYKFSGEQCKHGISVRMAERVAAYDAALCDAYDSTHG